MKSFTKFIALILALAMVFALASCGKNDDENESATEKITTTKVVGASAKVDKSYFDDVVFVGDSVTLKLYYYDIKTDVLGNAAFLTSGSLGVTNCLWDLYAEKEVHPSYQGTKMRVPDGVKATGRSKVYIMLGMNDIYLYGIDSTIESLKTLAKEIKEKNPEAEFFMQSVTPIYGNKIAVTNDLVNQYNEKLILCCQQEKWKYIDVSSVLKDKNGELPLEYCGDPDAMGIHFSDAGCQVWADYLYTHTK